MVHADCPLKKFILPARVNIVQIKFQRKLKLIMPHSEDKKTPRVSFTILKKQMAQIYTAERFSEMYFSVFSTSKSQQITIQQSHIINPLLTSFAQSVRERLYL